MLRSTSISQMYKDNRRDRRYQAPPVALLLGGAEYPARNWSLSGLLLESAPAVALGRHFIAHLSIPGRADVLEFTAEALRHDPKTGGLACRFVEPSAAMVSALDAAVARRFLRRRNAARAGLGAALVAALLAAHPAQAGETGVLVPGSAPLPEFTLNFPNLLLEPLGPPPTNSDLHISLDSPGHGAINFLFSPRSRFGLETDALTGTSRSYAGLTWNLFDRDGFYGNLSLAGSMTRLGPEEMYGRELGPPLAFHSGFEFGYQIGARHSLTLSLDRATDSDPFGDRSEFDDLRLRYGLKF
jgi:hypothetical protein